MFTSLRRQAGSLGHRKERSPSTLGPDRYPCIGMSWRSRVSPVAWFYRPQTGTLRFPRLSYSSMEKLRMIWVWSRACLPSIGVWQSPPVPWRANRIQSASWCCSCLSIRHMHRLLQLWRKTLDDSSWTTTKARIEQFYTRIRTTPDSGHVARQASPLFWVSVGEIPRFGKVLPSQWHVQIWLFLRNKVHFWILSRQRSNSLSENRGDWKTTLFHQKRGLEKGEWPLILLIVWTAEGFGRDLQPLGLVGEQVWVVKVCSNPYFRLWRLRL